MFFLFKLIFNFRGWKVTHLLPEDIKKCVIVVAPHTSNWDFIYGMGTVSIMNLNQTFVIKKEWIRFPFKRFLLSLGAMPIDRNKKRFSGEKTSAVDSMVELFKTRDVMRLVITPEGTRSRVEKWKTGFYYVAIKAKVPIALAYINYENKTTGIDKIIYPTGDYKKDMKEIMDFYKNMKGKNNANFSIDVELAQ